MVDPLKPSASLLVKLASILVHQEEFTSIDAHPFDLMMVQSLLEDPEVKEWMAAMNKHGFLPVKRHG